MERKGSISGRRLLSWALAVLLIAIGAIAIGWFAGAALINLMGPQSASLTDDQAEAEGSVDGADASMIGADQPGTQEALATEPTLTLPAIAAQGSDSASDTDTSPFASPPWESNITIKPLDEAAGEAVSEVEPATPSVTEEQTPAGNEEQAAESIPAEAVVATPAPQGPADATRQAAAPEVSNSKPQPLYKVRVGPYPTKAEAEAAAKQLAETGIPTLVIQDMKYFVQTGAFTVLMNAENLMKKIKDLGFNAIIAN